MGLVHRRDMRKAVQPGQTEGEEPVRLSKTQKKKEALSLQELGERLVTLTDQQLDQVELPEDIHAAVKMAKTIKKHSPLKRQVQHIGALMRHYDPAPVRAFLDALDKGQNMNRKKGKEEA